MYPNIKNTQISESDISVDVVQVEESVDGLNGEPLKAYLKEIKATGLKKVTGGRLPDPFAVVTVDGTIQWTTEKLQKTVSPRWRNNLLILFRPSSTINIELFRTSIFRGRRNYLLGKYGCKVIDLIEGEVTVAMNDDKEIANGAQLSLHLVLQESPDIDPNGLRYANDKASAVHASIQHMNRLVDGSRPLASISETSDSGIAIATTAQGIYENTQATGSCVQHLGRALQSLEQIVKVVDGIAEVHPLCKVAWMFLSSVYKVLRQQLRQDDDIRDLAVTLRDSLAFANDCPDLRGVPGATDVIRDIARATVEAASLIDEYARLPFVGRTLRSVITSDFANRIQASQKRFSDLNELLDRTVLLEMRRKVTNLAQYSVQKEQRELLDRLPRISQARHDPARRCLDDTRKEAIREVLDWASQNDPSGTRIFWLHGQAGAGKSTIATSIACSLDDASRRWLGGSFFFSRDVATRSKPDNVLSSIAFQLSSLHRTIATGICQALIDDLDIGHSALSTQFQKLIRTPLRAADVLGKPVIILLDALDECGTEKERKSLLGVIRGGFSEFPAAVKFVITSRPDADIHAAFSSMGSLVRSFDLSSLPRELVDHDIKIFAEVRLKEIAQSYGFSSVNDVWPGKVRRETLIRQAAGLFLWMSIACEFIEDDNSDGPEAQLSLILAAASGTYPLSTWKAIDDLYNQVLHQAVSIKASTAQMTDLREILGAIVVAANPLSAACLSRLINFQSITPATPANAVALRLRKLRSVLAIPNQDNQVIQVIHPSFADFLTNPLRCADLRFFIDAKVHHCHLAVGCLDVMQKCLRHDICRLGIEPKTNQQVPDLEKLITTFIPEELQYACQFWAVHLCRSPIEDSDLYARVHKFAYSHLIHWLEVLSLMHIMDSSILSLELAEDWIRKSSQKHCTADDLHRLMQDGQRFVREFRKPLAASSGQIYISALPLCPRNTHLAKVFGPRYAGQIKVFAGARESWSSCIATLEGHQGIVENLACSPDGNFLASGSDDRTIRTWNLRTGAAAGMSSRRMRGHVTCLAYSEDGRYVIAGSGDHHLRVWDTQTWDQVVTPTHSFALALSCRPPNRVTWLSRHNTPNEWPSERAYCIDIQSACLSLDQSRLLQDAENHLCLQTHNSEQPPQSTSVMRWYNTYTSTALPPAGDSCVIAGDDFKLRFWNTQTGAQVGPLLEGHTCRILDVAFSHDGTRLVSTSLDKSVRIWDTTSGATIVIIEDANERVAFSNDGNFIVSGANDWTVRVWDANSGEMIGLPLTGHIGYIASVAFSPDDQLVISGSGDGNVRVWDWQSGSTEKIRPSRASAIVYVNFSPSGRRALSVSRSLYICVWDTTSGVTIGVPWAIDIEGKFHAIFAVTFSEDAEHIIIIVDNEIQVWAVDSQNLVRAASLHGSGNITSLVLCPARTAIAACYEGDPHIYIQDWCSGCTSTVSVPMTCQGEPRELSLAFTVDGKLFVSAMDDDGVAEVLDLTQFKTALGLQFADPHGISPSDLSRMLASTTTMKRSIDQTDVLAWPAHFDRANPESTKESFWAVPTRRITANAQDSELATDLHMIDGWIRGPDERDLFWLPVENRERDSLEMNSIPYAVSASGNQMLLGGQRLTFLDFSDVHDEQSRPLFHFFNNLPVVGEIDIH